MSSKRDVGTLDGTPDKRLFWSIINDYDIPTAICELIDNSLDLWMKEGRANSLCIKINADSERQTIDLEDTAGGISPQNLRLLISPGSSANDPDGKTIGVFGVGSKRAAVALAENITFKTRHKGCSTYQIDIDPAWLSSEEWDIPHYEINEIDEGKTIIEFRALRRPILPSTVSLLRAKIAETYSWFLAIDNCSIILNEKPVGGKDFDNWAFPEENPPHILRSKISVPGGGDVALEMTAGLIYDRDPVVGNYGVYFYCNERLIDKEVQDREVGYYVTTQAGVPHPDASLCRVIVRLSGPAKLMPWNSSKTKINYNHPVFQSLQDALIKLVSHFSSLSRRLKDDWDGKVFAFKDGVPNQIAAADIAEAKRIHLPQLPRVLKKHIEKLRSLNKQQLEDQPWTLGLLESVAAVEIIGNQKLQTRNRIALILLDSTFEIALKEFVVHRADLFPSVNLQDLFKRRDNVIDAVAAKIHIRDKLLDRAKHYYGIRNKLVHERATVDVTDLDIKNYRSTVEKILNLLFQLQFMESA